MTRPELYLSCVLQGKLVDGVPVWAPIDDGPHRPYGVLSVEYPVHQGTSTLTDRVRVHHAPIEAIGDVQATADETYAKNKIAAGTPSVNLAYFDVFLTRSDTGARVKPSDGCIPGANIWCNATGWLVEPASL